jgi:hypothetical protein
MERFARRLEQAVRKTGGLAVDPKRWKYAGQPDT